ncbi:tellurite resistance TerB family protein [Enterobacter huaxiensis]|uniref:tellurite resistance TerB family protein n=1 Tax=Enterobacter huaxiensis TaxID=2494702 RepID=UPI0021760162|nr:TerB family tellurite resistance protein [Enterobacter huaxiensis]MCS5452524.1 TerB family tellurite resistance protein [Enterobacter huaxiensis]
MFGFGKKAAAAKTTFKKMENRDLMEALICGCILVAGADGELEASELDRVEAIIKTNDKLAHFGAEISNIIAKYKEKFEKVGFQVLKFEAKREISDIKHNADNAAEVFVNMIAIALADGEIEPAEEKVLEEIGRMMGLRVEDFI